MIYWIVSFNFDFLFLFLLLFFSLYVYPSSTSHAKLKQKYIYIFTNIWFIYNFTIIGAHTENSFIFPTPKIINDQPFIDNVEFQNWNENLKRTET